jgi:hypothetical protein
LELRNVYRFIEVGSEIQMFYSNFKADAMPGTEMGAPLRRQFVEKLGLIGDDCGVLGLPRTRAVVECLINEYTATEHTHQQLKASLTHLTASFREELNEHRFIQFDPSRIRYLTTIEEFAQSPFIGEAVVKNFSSAVNDIRNAGICYAAYRNTACVFHCMRVIERGLRSLANELHVKFSVPFEYQEWHSIIDAIESEIKKLEQQPRGQVKSDKLKFYSQTASQFFYFKNAWRNHVSHAREDYGDEETIRVFDHCGDFMRYLAEGGLHD